MAATPPYDRLRAAEEAALEAFTQATKVHAVWVAGAHDVLVEVWHGKTAVVWNPTPDVRTVTHPRERAPGRRTRTAVSA